MYPEPWLGYIKILSARYRPPDLTSSCSVVYPDLLHLPRSPFAVTYCLLARELYEKSVSTASSSHGSCILFCGEVDRDTTGWFRLTRLNIWTIARLH